MYGNGNKANSEAPSTLLLAQFFQTKVSSLMSRYLDESLENDQKNGFRDLTWSEYKRSRFVPGLMDLFNKKECAQANSGMAFADEFKARLYDFSEKCETELKEYNRTHAKENKPGRFETVYLLRIENMLDHLQSLYAVFSISDKKEDNLLSGDKITSQRNRQVQALFDSLYSDVMPDHAYQFINELIEYLEEGVDTFENNFEKCLARIKSSQPEYKDDNAIRIMHDAQFDIELKRCLDQFYKENYKTEKTTAQESTSAYLSYFSMRIASLGQWLAYGAGTTVYNTTQSLGERLLDWWVNTEGPRNKWAFDEEYSDEQRSSDASPEIPKGNEPAKKQGVTTHPLLLTWGSPPPIQLPPAQPTAIKSNNELTHN